MFEFFFKKQAIQKKRKFLKEDFFAKYNNEFILITGAGGSIGSKIVELLLKVNYKNVILLDHSELNLFNLKNKLQYNNNYKFEIADIRDSKRLFKIISKYKPKLIIHTAAYKHVSILENNYYELLRTNLEGTINVFKSSIKSSVTDFIFISTDKAVNPINKMGVSKKIAELYLKSFFNQNKVNLKIIRFGNVINSSGSVIPIFLNNISNEQSIIVRNELVERYFIYDDVVARCVLNISIDNFNSSYLLEMNSPIKILDLAKYLIKEKDSNVKIEIKKINKEEKLNEELLSSKESLVKSNYTDCYNIKEELNLNELFRKKILKIVELNKEFKKKEVVSEINKLNFLPRNIIDN